MATGLDAQQTIFASNPDDRRAFEALEEHFFLDGDWAALAELYRTRIDAPGVTADPGQQAPLLFRLGQIEEERLLDLDAASETYWTLVRLDPANRPALRQLRGIHARRGQWDVVIQIAEIESATEMPPFERAAFEAELGRTWHVHLQDQDEARLAYERALAVDPDFPPALEGLAELHREAGRLREAAHLLELLTQRLRGPERAPVWITLGTLLAGPLDERDRARHCFAAALEDDPFQSAAVEWSLLLATEAEDWPLVSDLLESRFDLASGARSRGAIAVEASQIQLNHLGSVAGARAWIERALELSSDEPAVLLACGDVERAEGDREGLLATLDRLIVCGGRVTPRAALLEAAELHAEFGHDAKALETIRRAAERSGADDERVLLLHARLLREDGDKTALAEVLETLTGLDGASPETRAAQLRELAVLQEQDLGDEDAALGSWRRAFDLDPGPGAALDALDRLYRKRDDWSGLREVLHVAREAAPGAAGVELDVRLGHLILDHFDDPHRARVLFEAALTEDDDCREALAGLRRLADASDDPDLLLTVCEREARGVRDAERMGVLVGSVRPVLEARGDLDGALAWAMRWTECAEAPRDAWGLRADLERRLERPEAEVESRRALARLQVGRERGETLLRQAALHELLDQTVEHAATLELALESGADQPETLAALCDAYRRLDRPQDLVRTLRQLVERLPPADQADALEELAATLQDPLGDLDTAIVVRWRLVELPDAPVEAPGKLEALLELAGRHAELAQLLFTRRQRLGDDSDEAFELDLRRGRLLLDSLGHCDEAAEIFGALHARHPDSDEILDLYERALRGSDDAAALSDLLARRVEWAPNDEIRAALQLERARLHEENLGEPEVACDVYAALLADHPEAPSADEADQRLELLLESTGQWQRLKSHLAARADRLPAAEEATLRETLAVLCRDRLHDAGGCAEQLERVAALSPDRVHVWQQLEEIYAGPLDRPADWLRVVEAELDAGPDADRAMQLHIAAARLCLDAERRPEGRDEALAYEHYERVLALRPGHAEAAEVLALHFEKTDRPARAAEVLEGRLAEIAERAPSDASELRLRLAHLYLYADAIGDDDRARTLLEQVLEAEGASPEVADPLARVHERSGDHAALAELARRVLAREGIGEEALVWRLRLGASEQALGHLDEAAVAFRAALVVSPDDRAIEDALIEIYERVDEVEPLAELLEKRLGWAVEDEAIDLRLRLARLHADGRDEPEAALQHLEWILDELPQHRDAFERAVALAERMDDPARVVALLDRGLGQTLPDRERADLLERRAELFAGPLDSPEQAVLAYREAVSLDRERPSTRAGLRAQLERLGRWPAVLDCLFVDAAAAPAEARRGIYEEAAEIAWARINPDASLPWLTRLAELDPEDPEIPARIAEVHRRAGRFEAALGALDREIALRSDASERCGLHLQCARMLERELHSPARAIEAYRKALALSRDPDEILLELDRLLDLMGRPAERAEILARRVERAPEAERTPLRRTLASLYCVDLARPDRAIPHLEANAEAIDPGDGPDRMAALGALDAALRATGRLDDWTEVAERELALVEADPRVAETTPPEFIRYLREELARTWDQLLGDTDRALTHLRALCADPDVATGPIGERLRALLRRTGRRRELAERLAALDAAGAASPREQLELGHLLEEAMLDLPGARAAYERAEAEPTLALEAIRGRRRVSERLADWAGLADALADEFDLEAGLDRSERGALARRLGEIAWTRLGAPERAIEAYGQALDLDPDDLVALRALVPIREAAGATEAVVALHRQELERLPEDEANAARRKTLFARIGRLLADPLEAWDEAIAAFGEAAAIDRLAPEDEKRLAQLHDTVGDRAAFTRTFGRWCDREDAGATVHDHLDLALALMEHGDAEAAAARCERATVVDPENADAWALRATLASEAGEPEAAALAWSRAADHAPPTLAAGHCVSAARCLDGDDDDRARALLARAIEFDPAHLPAQVECARVAAHQSRDADVLLHAERALELERHDRLEDGDRLEIALLAARAARTLNDLASTQRHFGIALEVDPDHVEALEGLGRARAEDGDPQGAREPLERRLAIADETEAPAPLLTIVAEGLELDDLLDAAWTRYEEALSSDTSYTPAHAGLVRVHERAGRIEEALTALERWSESAGDASERASAAFRAAEHALALDRPETAITHLEFATETDPGRSEAWALLCELAAQHGPETELRGLCERALDAMPDGPLAAPIALRAARAAEVDGDLEHARERYDAAARWDPRGTEAALCASRLARQAGDWPGADAALARFLEAHPDPDSPTLAHVHLERGRLLSGPLEDFDGAVRAYEAALRLGPELGVARSALASLLVHTPERWREAVGLHREILEAQPATARSLRAIVQIAERRGRREIAEAASTLLQALGLASPEERSETPAPIRFPVHPGPPMAETMAERLRRIAHPVGDELREVLASAVSGLPETGAPDVDAAIREIAAIEDELSAPGLGRLTPEERSELFQALAGLFLDPGGNGGDARFRGALEETIGRWTRRKVRRIVEETTLDAIAAVDQVDWGDELRAMAAAHAIDRDGGALEPVLRALLVLDPETAESPAFEGASLATLTSGCEPARRLLRRIVSQLCERLEQDR